MREIKFRAWDGRQMFNVDVLAISPCTWACPDYGRRGVSLAYQPSIKVMQYTGLKDKNGKDIYEGDIISTDLERPFNIVVFRNGAFMFQCHDNGKDYYDYMFSVDEESDRWEYGEVIGNVFENGELLNDCEEA